MLSDFLKRTAVPEYSQFLKEKHSEIKIIVIRGLAHGPCRHNRGFRLPYPK